MSVLVKGMEMPLYATRNGEKDTIYQCAVVVHKDNTAELVVRRESAYPFANCNEAHIDKYPLIEVQTPHGRLIDADKLTKNMRNYYPSIDHLCCSQHVVTKGDIDNAPTVIEAEHESEARKWARVGRDTSKGLRKGLQEGIEAINSEVPE